MDLAEVIQQMLAAQDKQSDAMMASATAQQATAQAVEHLAQSQERTNERLDANTRAIETMVTQQATRFEIWGQVWSVVSERRFLAGLILGITATVLALGPFVAGTLVPVQQLLGVE